jgi:hypothetical protein
MDLQSPQFGEILEQGKQTTTNTVKTAISDTANSISGQIGIKNETNARVQNPTKQAANQADENVLPNQQTGVDNEFTKEMVEDFYAPSSNASPGSRPKNQEEYETQQKLLKIRQDLHNETYYDPLFAYEHKKEEKPAETVQREEQQQMQELAQNQEKKLPPLAVQRAQTSVEINRGVSG